MPICWVMWSQVPGVPRPCSLAFSWSLISRTRSAMVFTLPFLQRGGEKSETSENENEIHPVMFKKTLQHLMRGECFNIKMKDSFHFNRQLKVQECVSWHWQQLCGSWTDRAAYHSAKSSGQLRVLLTMRAPWDGGLDQVVLTIFSIWDRMRVRFSLSWATTVRLPTLSSDNSGREKRDCFIKSHLQCSVVKPPRKTHVSTHCTGQSFWRRTEPRTAQSPRRQSSGWPRRLYPDCRRRNPDRPSQRTRTSSSSRDTTTKRRWENTPRTQSELKHTSPLSKNLWKH